jgi:serine/threonine protein kinase
LYGKTPYTAQNPKELLENIRTKPLIFPENIPRSEQIKDLLRSMLRIEEEKRISMIDLINHDYVRLNFKEEPIMGENSLAVSFASSQSYMSRNKVVTKTSVSPEVSNNLVSQKDKAE